MQGRGVVLHHGTTRNRAEAILRDGPNPYYVEPGDVRKLHGFSANRPNGPFPVGTPLEYAMKKANLFPHEGGPVILEFEVPDEIMRLDDVSGEIRFEPGCGLTELLQA